jgi:hypothetical protein
MDYTHTFLQIFHATDTHFYIDNSPVEIVDMYYDMLQRVQCTLLVYGVEITGGYTNRRMVPCPYKGYLYNVFFHIDKGTNLEENILCLDFFHGNFIHITL